MPESVGSWKRFVRWTRDQLVGDVPIEMALCEFDCARGECSMEEWATCERRHAQAAGELMPEIEAAEQKTAMAESE